MSAVVTVIGASGNTGKAVAATLLERGFTVRAVARSKSRLEPLAAAGAEVRNFDLADTRLLTAALSDADAAFVMVPQQLDARDYTAHQRILVDSLIASLESGNVPRVVALSTPGSRARVGMPALLADFENRLKEMAGLSVVVLKPMFYMENHLAFVPMIRHAGITGGAIRADLPVPMIATRDVAKRAVECFQDWTFTGYSEQHLLGPRDYTFREASSVLGAAIGMADLPYVEFPPEDAKAGLIGAGFSASAAAAFLDMASAMNDGRISAGVPRDATNTTDTTLDAFARDTFAPAYLGAG